MTTTAKLTTAEALLNMPADGFRYELVQGELRKMAPAGWLHGRIAAKAIGPLVTHVYANALGEVFAAETGFLLATDPDHVRAPDAAFVIRERANLPSDTRGFFPGAPDVAIEVISPSDTYADVDEKVLDWLHAGTQAVLVINPRSRTVRLHLSPNDVVCLTEDDVLDISAIVDGWRLPVREIFE